MLNNYMALLTLHKPLDDMSSLIKYRNHASLPIGGRYKLIDFHLSNVTNADIINVAIVGNELNNNTLVDHVGTGASWDLDRKNNGVTFLDKYKENSYNDRIEILENNLKYFFRSTQKNVVIVDTSMIYNINLKDVIKAHESNNSDATMVYKKVSGESYYQRDIVIVNSENRVISVSKNANFNEEFNLSLGIIIISKPLMIKLIGEEIAKNNYSTFKAAIFDNIQNINISAYEFKGAAASINSVIDYYKFNLSLLDPNIKNDIFNSERPISTRRKDTPSTYYEKGCEVSNSLVSNGCQIRGSVKNSVLSRRVKIDKGATVENCVIMQRCHIKTGANLKNIILDVGNEIAAHETLVSSPTYPFVVTKDNTLTSELWSKLMKGDIEEFINKI
ncbi:MAG: glucose-1-phosphate adenylyltransferase subunit GlgD [Fusobacteriaceae bacterium]|nr:glucose-1-phosphate adenylyltransferase subunit GlgD [Fusobacteriaceae bacterium]